MTQATRSPPGQPPGLDRKSAFRAAALDTLIGLLFIVAVLVAALPFVALFRGIVTAAGQGFRGGHAFGVGLALVALLLGSFFFLYSIKYYLGTLVVLISAVVLGSRPENGRTNGNGHPHGLMRFIRRRNGAANGIDDSNGGANGHFDLGYEPFVSIHIATYNEKRVVGRLLEACSALEYENYEVVVVDDSTDETTAILEGWESRPRFKVIHRPTRDGFKGGALQVALEHTDARAEFVIVWDADVVPFADSIQTFLPHFFRTNGNGNHGHGGATATHPAERRPEVAAVQSYQWHVLNKSESWLTQAVRAEYAGSYMVERPFQEAVRSLKMIAGTAYMIRADLLRRLGWGRSLTEDWELTLRLYALGFKVVYTPYAESPAECVSTVSRLARQRMRWAEGHSFNVRRRFGEMMLSRRLSVVEKAEFLFYSTYYLQAALFTVGSGCWLVAEILLHAHVPEWTATLGWSLLLTNLLSLPLMNLSGLLLEEAPIKDFPGVLGALAISFLLIPFQGFAAVKGLIEKDEGQWYRTPKTGRITDPVHHLRRLIWLRRWLRGPGPSSRQTIQPLNAVPARVERGRGSRLGWVVAAALGIALAALGLGAVNAPIANAAGTSLFLHGGGPGTLDTTSPAGVLPQALVLAPGITRTWATTSSTAAAQTISSSTSFTFNYWTLGVGGSANVTLTFAFSSSGTCSSPTTIAQTTTTLSSGSNLTTGSFSPSSNVSVPAGSFFCFTLTVNTLGTALTLDYDAATSPSNLISTQLIFIPELVLPFLGLALLAPIGVRRLSSRRKSQAS